MKKISLLAALLLSAVQMMAQEPATSMIMKTTNGAVVRTDIAEVEKITFTDEVFNTNSGGYQILEHDELCWPEDRLLPCFMPPATVQTLDMPAAGLSDEERVMFCTLQGLVNRTCPRILLYNHKEEPVTTWPQAHGLKQQTVSTRKPYSLVKMFEDELNGLILYSTEKSEHMINLAVTIAGLDRLLPVTEEIKAKLEDEGVELPVKEDLTTLNLGSAQRVYNHLYKNYWDRCNHRLIVSERPKIPYLHDIAAAAGSACIWLDPRVAAEKVLYDKFLADLTPGRDVVIGWYPEERSGVGEATRYGLSTVPGDFFENTTVYAAVNNPVKINPVPKRPKLENKVYAALYISDGDNVQYCQHAMAKIFEQGGRGKIPMNWTISPALADVAPMMLNYYYGKATTNDCFVSGPSGLGYAMPYDAHNYVYYAASNDGALITPYAQITNRYLEKSGLRVITIWDDISAAQRKAYADNCPYLYGLTINDWERQTGRLTYKVQDGWLPVVVQYPCYASGVDVITNFFNRDIKNFKGDQPMFVSGQVTVWDVGPDKLQNAKTELDALSPGNVNIVRADHWFSYYNEANHLPFNLTLLKDMEVTSSKTRTRAAYAANGSPSDGYQWVSRTDDGTGWVEMDFKEPFVISRYVVRHAEAGGLDAELNTRDFTVEVSLDGETWTTVGTHTRNIAPVTDEKIADIEARYVRVNITNGGADGVARIADIEVYGKH